MQALTNIFCTLLTSSFFAILVSDLGLQSQPTHSGTQALIRPAKR